MIHHWRYVSTPPPWSSCCPAHDAVVRTKFAPCWSPVLARAMSAPYWSPVLAQAPTLLPLVGACRRRLCLVWPLPIDLHTTVAAPLIVSLAILLTPCHTCMSACLAAPSSTPLSAPIAALPPLRCCITSPILPHFCCSLHVHACLLTRLTACTPRCTV